MRPRYERELRWIVVVLPLALVGLFPLPAVAQSTAGTEALLWLLGLGAAKPSVTVDLNTATQQALQKLPDVDDATARKIIAGRPYASVGELSRIGVPARTIEKIRPLVSVKPGPSSPNLATRTPAPRERIKTVAVSQEQILQR